MGKAAKKRAKLLERRLKECIRTCEDPKCDQAKCCLGPAGWESLKQLVLKSVA